MTSPIHARLIRAFMALVALGATALVPVSATAMAVRPVVVDLTASGRGMATTLTVENSFDRQLPVELRIQELTFDGTGAKPTDEDGGDLLVFPPQALIEPGQTQSFRLQYVGDPALAKSKHYYVTVAQLPVQLPSGQSAIQILYNFQVLVSVGVPGASPNITATGGEITVDDNGKPNPTIIFTNDANMYGYAANGRMSLVQKDAAGKEVFKKDMSQNEVQQLIGFGLVAPGQTRRITLPIELPSAEGALSVQYTYVRPR